MTEIAHKDDQQGLHSMDTDPKRSTQRHKSDPQPTKKSELTRHPDRSQLSEVFGHAERDVESSLHHLHPCLQGQHSQETPSRPSTHKDRMTRQQYKKSDHGNTCPHSMTTKMTLLAEPSLVHQVDLRTQPETRVKQEDSSLTISLIDRSSRTSLVTPRLDPCENHSAQLESKSRTLSYFWYAAVHFSPGPFSLSSPSSLIFTQPPAQISLKLFSNVSLTVQEMFDRQIILTRAHAQPCADK